MCILSAGPPEYIYGKTPLVCVIDSGISLGLPYGEIGSDGGSAAEGANPQPFVGLTDLILFTWDADSGYIDMEDHHYGPEPRSSL